MFHIPDLVRTFYENCPFLWNINNVIVVVNVILNYVVSLVELRLHIQ